MATKRTTPTKASKSGKRALTIRKDTIKDLIPDARAPKGGALGWSGAPQGQTLSCVAITPYKQNISY